MYVYVREKVMYGTWIFPREKIDSLSSPFFGGLYNRCRSDMSGLLLLFRQTKQSSYCALGPFPWP
jgi:hypothetical protein